MAKYPEDNIGPMKLIFNYNNVFYSFFYDDLSGCIHQSREYALNYVYSGEMVLDNGTDKIHVRKGECVFIPRDHRITMYKKTYRGERYCGIFLMFTRKFLRNMYGKLSLNKVRTTTDRLDDGVVKTATSTPTTRRKPATRSAPDWQPSGPRTIAAAPRNPAAVYPTYCPRTRPLSSATTTITTRPAAAIIRARSTPTAAAMPPRPFRG